MGQSHETFTVNSEPQFNDEPRLWTGARSLAEVVRKAYVGSDGSPLIAFEPMHNYPVNNIGIHHIDGQQMFDMEIE